MTDTIPQTQPQSPVNPLLERARLPGQTFLLPSKAIFYTHGEVDDSVISSKGEVMIYPMITLDEINIKTPDKLINGTAITDVFKRCIPQINQPLELLSKDVDFLLICLRKVTYGDQYRFEHEHDCENAKEHSYEIPLDPLISNAKTIDVKKVKQNYTLTLPNGQVVKLIPPKYFQMLKFFQVFGSQTINEVSDEELSQEIIRTTVSMIDNVDGISNQQQILEWAQQIPAGYARLIGKRVNEVSSWGANLETNITCQDCKKEVSVHISLNPLDFFS